MTASIGKGNGVTGDRREAGADPEKLALPRAVPGTNGDEHSREANHESTANHEIRPFLAKDSNGCDNRGERGECVDEPGKYC